MADTKISALSSAGTLVGTEVLPLVQSGDTVKTTVADIADLAELGAAPVSIGVALSDESTPLSTGAAIVTMRAPFAFTASSVRATLTTASSSGNPTVDIKESGTTILSTKVTVDAGETTSTTASTAAVISDGSIADDAVLTFDIDVAGTDATGLKVWIFGTRA